VPVTSIATVTALPSVAVQGTASGIQGNVQPRAGQGVPGSADPSVSGGIIGSVG
jgi:hypothetical protein